VITGPDRPAGRIGTVDTVRAIRDGIRTRVQNLVSRLDDE
jgi:hypothetical protein